MTSGSNVQCRRQAKLHTNSLLEVDEGMKKVKLHKAHNTHGDTESHSLTLPHELDLMTTDQPIEP